MSLRADAPTGCPLDANRENIVSAHRRSIVITLHPHLCSFLFFIPVWYDRVLSPHSSDLKLLWFDPHAPGGVTEACDGEYVDV